MYERNIRLHHDESPAKINKRTGEVTEIEHHSMNNGMKTYNLMPTYQRINIAAWKLLETQTSDIEYLAAHKLALMARAYTNSLIPLNDDTTASELAGTLNVDRRKINLIIDKLFKLGVLGKFEIYEHNEQHMKYWVFNPYLSFNGNTIKKNVITLFDGTTYALVSSRN